MSSRRTIIAKAIIHIDIRTIQSINQELTVEREQKRN
jgi:hypothetical protein